MSHKHCLLIELNQHFHPSYLVRIGWQAFLDRATETQLCRKKIRLPTLTLQHSMLRTGMTAFALPADVHAQTNSNCVTELLRSTQHKSGLCYKMSA